MLNLTLLRKTLSRPRDFISWHGITQDKRDYLSVTKDQGQEGLCWAYALTATFEMSYALKSGNRLMLNPNFIYDHAVPWWKEQSKSQQNQYKNCLAYGEEKGYNPVCATIYLTASGDSIEQMDGDDSFLTITNAESVDIKTLLDLYRALDKYGVLYIGIDADDEFSDATIVNQYKASESNNHAIVLTAVGEIKGNEGVYIEILNSWGYRNGYDGLQYIKIADNNLSYIINNHAVFNTVIGIMVDRNPLKQYADMIWALIVTILFVIALVMLIVISCKYHKLKHSGEQVPSEQNSALEDLNNDTVEVKPGYNHI